MRTDDVTALLQEVADRLVLPRFRALAAHEVIHKRPGDLVTVADREAEVAIGDALAAADPGALVLGEEAAFADPRLPGLLAAAERAWVIDPVDGTRNFAAGSPDFGVMLAETRLGVAVRGWIWQPVHGRLYVAERGGGVWRDGVRLSPVAAGGGAWRAAVPRAWRTPDPRVSYVARQGACALEYPALLEGNLDAIGFTRSHAWDHLPGALMLAELGGLAATGDARPFSGSSRPGPILATADHAVWPAVAEVVWREVRARPSP